MTPAVRDGAAGSPVFLWSYDRLDRCTTLAILWLERGTTNGRQRHDQDHPRRR